MDMQQAFRRSGGNQEVGGVGAITQISVMRQFERRKNGSLLARIPQIDRDFTDLGRRFWSRSPKSGHRMAAEGWSPLGGGPVVQFPQIWMSSGECRFNQVIA